MTLSHSFSGIDQLLQPKITEDVEIVDDQEDTHAIAAYSPRTATWWMMSHASNASSSNPLAVETITDGITIEQLWRVV
jgi:hypothetical protein